MTQLDSAQMPEPGPASLEDQAPVAPANRRSRRWLVPVAALAVALAAGAGGVAASADPTQTPEYLALAEELTTTQDSLQDAQSDAADAKQDAGEIRADWSRAQSDLMTQQAALQAREEAVATTEAQVAARSVGEGVWTVGVDIEPGTYRASSPVVSSCYWAILVTGTNGSDIVENDNVAGGYPTVTLSVGQDFQSKRCPTFVKQ